MEKVPAKPSEYSAELFGDNYPPGMQEHYWIRARSLIIRRLLRRTVSQDAEILDIGCGTGIVLECLVQAGMNCRGVELGTPPVLPSIADRVWVGRRYEALHQEYRNSVEHILLLDVLEHIPQPESFLRDVADSLPQHRQIIVTVPARHELWSNYDEHFGHFRRYDQVSLRQLIEASGYRLVDMGYFFHTLYPPMLACAILGAHRQVKNRSPRGLWIHRLLSRWFLLESIVLPRWLVGGSLYAVATRR